MSDSWWGEQCIVRTNRSTCVNCSRRFPPVECVIPQVDRAGSAPSFQGRILRFDDPAAPDAPGISLTTLVRRAAAPLPREPGDSKGQAQTRVLYDPATNTVTITQDDRIVESFPLRGQSRSLFLDGSGDPEADMHVRPFGGILTEINSLNSMPMDSSGRNAELLHFYVRFVAPNLVSIDGQSQPMVFLKEVLPWMLQSPLFPRIGMLMASTTQSLERGVELAKDSESLAIKSLVLSGINDLLRGDFGKVSVEVIRSVINLVVMEWFWGADDSMWAHLRGVRHMIGLKNGMRNVNDVVGESIMILTDYEIACCFESELFLQAGDPVLDEEIPLPTSWPRGFDSPTVPSETKFVDMQAELGLTAAAAQILDDVRFLVTSVTVGEEGPTKAPKARSTAAWLHRRLREMPAEQINEATPEKMCMQEAIRLAALIHSWSISSLSQISGLRDDALVDQAFTAMRSVSLTTWKRTPGIFLWVMLVAAPNTKQDARGRFVRRKMAVAGLSIGFEDFIVGISYLRAFWLVQRWIERTKECVTTPVPA